MAVEAFQDQADGRCVSASVCLHLARQQLRIQKELEIESGGLRREIADLNRQLRDGAARYRALEAALAKEEDLRAKAEKHAERLQREASDFARTTEERLAEKARLHAAELQRFGEQLRIQRDELSALARSTAEREQTLKSGHDRAVSKLKSELHERSAQFAKARQGLKTRDDRVEALLAEIKTLKANGSLSETVRAEIASLREERRKAIERAQVAEHRAQKAEERAARAERASQSTYAGGASDDPALVNWLRRTMARRLHPDALRSRPGFTDAVCRQIEDLLKEINATLDTAGRAGRSS